MSSFTDDAAVFLPCPEQRESGHDGAVHRLSVTSMGVLVPACVLALVGWVHARAWQFVADDAFITFRYARNLAELGVVDFNPGSGEAAVEGFSSPAWMLVLAAGARLGVAPHELAPWLTQLALVCCLVLVTLLARAVAARDGEVAWRWLDLLAAAVLVTIPECVVWAHGGLETSLVAACGLAAAWALIGERVVASAVLVGLAAWVRLDALVPLTAMGLALLPVYGAKWFRRHRGRIVQAVAIVLLLVGLQFAWRGYVFGRWLPNTWAIKGDAGPLRATFGVEYVKAWALGTHAWWLVLGVWKFRRHDALLLAPVVAQLVYAWWVGGDFMAYARFLLLATLLTWVLIGCWMARAIQPWIDPTSAVHAGKHRVFVGIMLAVFAASSIARARTRWLEDRASAPRWIDGHWEGVATMDRFARERLAVGSWMREHLPAETRISVGAAGAIAYASRLSVIDAYGLVDPEIATMPGALVRGGKPGHQRFAPASYVRRKNPDLVCHVGTVGARVPTEREAPRGFDRGYTWACISGARWNDARGSVDVANYCCRRPRGRVVGPFGKDEP